MSQNDPEVLRAEIARTRAELSDNVDTLTETANPKNIADRQVNKVKSAARGVREHLMGAPDDPYDSGTLGERAEHVKGTASAIGSRTGPSGALDTGRRRPLPGAAQGPREPARRRADRVRHRLPDLLRHPSSEKEQEAASRLQEKAAPLKDKVSEAASDDRRPAPRAGPAGRGLGQGRRHRRRRQRQRPRHHRQGRRPGPGPGLDGHGQGQRHVLAAEQSAGRDVSSTRRRSVGRYYETHPAAGSPP